MSNGGEVDGTKHCEKWLPLKCHSFEKEVIFHEFDFVLEINYLNANNFV